MFLLCQLLSTVMVLNLCRNPKARSCSLKAVRNHAREFYRKFSLSYSPTALTPLPTIAKVIGVKHVFVKDESFRFGLTVFKILGASYATVSVLSERLVLSLEGIDLESFKRKLIVTGESFTLYMATDGTRLFVQDASWLPKAIMVELLRALPRYSA